MKLKDVVAVITGGGSGLGEATAREFASAGAKIAILDLPVSPGAKVAESLGANAIFTPADVASADQAEAAIGEAVKKFGTVHIAINCAGIGRAMRTITKEGPHPLDLFSKVISVNLIGTFNVIRLAAAQMAKNQPVTADGERGVIVNTASVAAFDGQIGQAAYSASKGGVVALTLPVARDLSSIGIRVCTIAPGTFETPMLAGLPEPNRKALAAGIPFPQRLGRPQEYAALARQIVENEMLNGETIRLDGALRMPPR
jgi:3-hydroxyacyl-CoA dehydrogenase / 3-hydroxy-2-methylbutyryl-CoA dehydrogenase